MSHIPPIWIPIVLVIAGMFLGPILSRPAFAKIKTNNIPERKEIKS